MSGGAATAAWSGTSREQRSATAASAPEMIVLLATGIEGRASCDLIALRLPDFARPRELLAQELPSPLSPDQTKAVDKIVAAAESELERGGSL